MIICLCLGIRTKDIKDLVDLGVDVSCKDVYNHFSKVKGKEGHIPCSSCPKELCRVIKESKRRSNVATKNASFYSCRAGKPDAIKSHRTRLAAMKAAGEFGQIWITEHDTQRQVHRAADGSWMSVSPERGLAVDLKGSLIEHGLIDNLNHGEEEK